jgi:hypothetical protein
MLKQLAMIEEVQVRISEMKIASTQSPVPVVEANPQSTD